MGGYSFGQAMQKRYEIARDEMNSDSEVDRMNAEANLMRAQKMSRGTARVKGPGTRTSDSVPARLSRDEAVLNAGAADALGRDVIANLNKRFAENGAKTSFKDGVMRAAAGAASIPGYTVTELPIEEVRVGDTAQGQKASKAGMGKLKPKGPSAVDRVSANVRSRMAKPMTMGKITSKAISPAAAVMGAYDTVNAYGNQDQYTPEQIAERGGMLASTMKDAFPTISALGERLGNDIGYLVHGDGNPDNPNKTFFQRLTQSGMEGRGPSLGELMRKNGSGLVSPVPQVAEKVVRPVKSPEAMIESNPTGSGMLRPMPALVSRNEAGAIDSQQVTEAYERARGQGPATVADANAFARNNNGQKTVDTANMEFASRGMNITKSVDPKTGAVTYSDRAANPYIDQKFTAPHLGGAYTGREIGRMNAARDESNRMASAPIEELARRKASMELDEAQKTRVLQEQAFAGMTPIQRLNAMRGQQGKYQPVFVDQPGDTGPMKTFMGSFDESTGKFTPAQLNNQTEAQRANHAQALQAIKTGKITKEEANKRLVAAGFQPIQ